MNFFSKLIFIFLSFMLFAKCYGQKDSLDFFKYYSVRNKAIYDVDFKADYNLFLKYSDFALKQNKKLYFRDAIKVLESEIILKESTTKISACIESLFNLGVPLIDLQQNGIIYDYLENNPELEIIKEEERLLRHFYGGIHYKLLSSIYYIKAQDDLLRPYWRDSIARKIMQEVYVKNLNKLKSISLEYGFPGVNKVGYLYKDIDVLLIHGISSLKDTVLYKEWDKLLQKELFDFNILPSHYAGYTDNYYWRNFDEQIYGTVYINKNGKNVFEPKIKDVVNVDVLRKKIGLMPLWKYALLLGVDLPEDYKK